MGRLSEQKEKETRVGYFKAKLMLSFTKILFFCATGGTLLKTAAYHIYIYIFRIQRPTTDGIYQVIKSNRNLIIREKNQLDDLETQLKQLKLYNRNSSWKHPDTSR